MTSKGKIHGATLSRGAWTLENLQEVASLYQPGLVLDPSKTIAALKGELEALAQANAESRDREGARSPQEAQEATTASTRPRIRPTVTYTPFAEPDWTQPVMGRDGYLWRWYDLPDGGLSWRHQDGQPGLLR